jgi:hypothetical protein
MHGDACGVACLAGRGQGGAGEGLELGRWSAVPGRRSGRVGRLDSQVLCGGEGAPSCFKIQVDGRVFGGDGRSWHEWGLYDVGHRGKDGMTSGPQP